VCVAVCVFSLLVRNLSIVFSLVGSIAGGILCFSMPPAFAYRMMRLERQPMSALLRFGLVVQILFGFVLIALGLVVIVSDES
jgi:large-conductance mechanosensitive channel